jgi:hypothetical protein
MYRYKLVFNDLCWHSGQVLDIVNYEQINIKNANMNLLKIILVKNKT